jgi:YgiT-type zinc finger domain-containing protein
MKCVVCKHGQTKPGTMTATFERDGATLVFKDVPADVCQSCGESYLSSDTSQKLLLQAEEAVKRGVQVDVRRFVAA